MPQPQQPPPPPSAVPDRLRELARLVREADHLDPEAQRSLADLAEQMAESLSRPHLPTAEEMEMGQLAGELIAALHREEQAPVAATRHRLREAIVAAETRAPLVTETARELLDVIANLGI